MVYKMVFYVDGGCRYNGSSNAIGAAAIVLQHRGGNTTSWRQGLNRYTTPTNQRAEIMAIIMALEKAIEKYENLNGTPWLDVTIYSDSKYAVGCMTQWIYKWVRNGWINAAGNEVANRDLIEIASDLDDKVDALGNVSYIHIPRSENQVADEACNLALDEQEQTSGYDSDDW